MTGDNILCCSKLEILGRTQGHNYIYYYVISINTFTITFVILKICPVVADAWISNMCTHNINTKL